MVQEQRHNSDKEKEESETKIKRSKRLKWLKETMDETEKRITTISICINRYEIK